eukprot:4720181-Pleurochrysis_carterae.AAC.4
MATRAARRAPQHTFAVTTRLIQSAARARARRVRLDRSIVRSKHPHDVVVATRARSQRRGGHAIVRAHRRIGAEVKEKAHDRRTRKFARDCQRRLPVLVDAINVDALAQERTQPLEAASLARLEGLGRALLARAPRHCCRCLEEARNRAEFGRLRFRSCVGEQ